MSERRAEIAARVPLVLGLPAPEAAASIGISASKFHDLVLRHKIPEPRMIDGKLVWDVDELRDAFKAFPHRGATPEEDTWADYRR